VVLCASPAAACWAEAASCCQTVSASSACAQVDPQSCQTVSAPGTCADMRCLAALTSVHATLSVRMAFHQAGPATGWHACVCCLQVPC
jgi:hypothetical protein